MEYLNPTSSVKPDSVRNNHSSRNLTLNQFKQKLLETSHYTRSPKSKQPSLLPQIKSFHPLSTARSNISRVTESNGLSSLSILNTTTNTKSNDYRQSMHSISIQPTIEISEDVDYDETLEKDINPLISYYHFTSTSQAFNNFEKLNTNYSSTQQSELFSKYNLNKHTSETIRSFTMNNDDSESTTERAHNKTKYVINDEYFKNPSTSEIKIKMNKQIYENIMNITLTKQKKKYIETYKKVFIL
jgi:hypothetical protein